MGFWTWLFGKSEKITHEFFGEMVFIGGKRPSPSDYFECRRYFKSSDKPIEIGIDGEIAGPTETQVDFFKHIENNFQLIISSIAPLIEEEFRNWKEDFRIKDFTQEFTPVYLKIPRCDSKPIIWEIAFDSIHDLDHTFTITMSDNEATEVIIDG